MTKGAIAVVIPVRNEITTLPVLVAGLLNQTEPIDELVIVDGGSVDGTTEMALELTDGDPRVSVVLAGQLHQAAAGIWVLRLRVHHGSFLSTLEYGSTTHWSSCLRLDVTLILNVGWCSGLGGFKLLHVGGLQRSSLGLDSGSVSRDSGVGSISQFSEGLMLRQSHPAA